MHRKSTLKATPDAHKFVKRQLLPTFDSNVRVVTESFLIRIIDKNWGRPIKIGIHSCLVACKMRSCKISFQLLYCGNTMGHSIQLVSTLKTLGKYCGRTFFYHPTLLSIEGPRCRLQYFYWSENNVYLKDFQSRGMKWYITRAWQVKPWLHSIFLQDGVYCEPHYTLAQNICHN